MTTSSDTSTQDQAQMLLDLSRQKWLWMAERQVEQLDSLLHPSARFVHMGATLDKTAELGVISGGLIQYKRADISETSIEMIGDTAIVYSQLRLMAVVQDNEVTNPFSATEVYVSRDGRWQLAAMTFTRLLGD